MSNKLKLGILLSTFLVIAGAFAVLSAAPRSSQGKSLQGSPVAGLVHTLPQTLIFNRRLLSSTVSYSNSLTAVGSGFQNIDSPLTFQCPAATCTITAEQNVQVQGSVTGNKWAICSLTDGSTYMSQPNCPYLGFVSSDSSYIAGSFEQAASGITRGTHTVQTQLYTDAGANLSISSITYRLYVP